MCTIYVLFFRGIGFSNPQYKQLNLSSLVKVGHVGIKFQNERTIYGLSPSEDAILKAGGIDKCYELLKKHVYFEGRVMPDNDVFRQAFEMSQYGARCKVWVYHQVVAFNEFIRVKQLVKHFAQVKNAFRYTYPFPNGSFRETALNCVSFIEFLGISLPCKNGNMRVFVEKMIVNGAEPWDEVEKKEEVHHGP